MSAFTPLRRHRTSRIARLRHTLRPSLFELEGRVNPSSLVSIGDASLAEGDSGSSMMNFTVTRSGDLDSLVAVAYSTADGTAKAGVDYTATSGMLVIPAGATTATISVPVTGNLLLQGDRSFTVKVSSVVDLTPTTFTEKTDFDVSNLPLGVAIGDFNGDGKPDIAAAITTSDSVSILTNTTPDGATTPTFAPSVDFNAGSGRNVFAVSVADFNGDGKPDLAMANDWVGTVSILLNTTEPGATTPSFSPYTEFATGASPFTVTVGDINQDGKPDLTVANVNSNTVSVLLNTTEPGATTPTFAPKVDLAIGGGPNSIAIGDLNGDGKPDLAVGVPDSDYYSIFLSTTEPGATTATFGPRIDFTTPSQTGPVSVAIGDLNGDGKPDLAVSNVFASTLWVLLNTTEPGATTPTFADKVEYATGTHPTSVQIRDLNGDGVPDIGFVNGTNSSLSVLPNTTVPGSMTASFADRLDFATNSTPQVLAIGDLNGDGKPDLAVQNFYSNNVSVFLNTSPPPVTITVATATGTILDDDAPASISIVAGDQQSVQLGGTFATNLSVLVLNAAGNPVQGAPVAFSSPAVGATGLFEGGTAAVEATTGADGIATAPTFTGNDVAGGYGVSAAAAGGDPSVTFILYNEKFAPSFSGLESTSIIYGDASITLSGHIDAGDNIPAGETITITIGAVVAQATIDANGDFTTVFDTSTIPASTTPYVIDYELAESANFAAASDTSTSLVVGRKALTISGDTGYKTYGDTVTYVGDEFLAVGLINQDTVTGVSLVSQGAAADADVMPTPYAVIPSDATGTGLSNYAITYINGILTVLPKHIQGAFSASGKTYDGTMATFVTSRSTVGDLGGVSLVGGIAMFDDPNAAPGKTVRLVGATLEGPGALNYVLDSVIPTTASIDPAPTVTTLVTSSNPSTFGQSVTFTATISLGLTGSVSFYDRGIKLGEVPLTGETASFVTAALTTAEHSIKAVYSGDDNHASSTSLPLTQLVNQAATTTTLTSSPNPGIYQQTVNLTAAVTPGATGIVNFYDNGVIFGNAAIVDGKASIATTLAVGGHPITATYTGDANYLDSTSAVLAQFVIRADSVTTLTASPSPSTYGQALTFTASVNAGATGSVLFFDGGSLLGLATIAGSTAVFTTSSALDVGSHDIRAIYVGDGNYFASTSPAFTQVVAPADSATSLTASLSSIGRGRAVLLTADVTPGAEGSVTFYDGNRAIGTGTITGSTATLLTRRPLLAGRHALTAIFDGGSNYAGSVSNTVRFTSGSRIPNAPIPTTPTPDPSPVRPGFVPQLQQLAAEATPRPSRFRFGRR
ncbi:beta strand repeat-containing protein [Singulisphaera sp. PoT]|uniref:beta strand repeat-containing protein n=1 Tax=Singulisphaera sp. PoT TaxID=3411797 RepID=UPI003BF4C282